MRDDFEIGLADQIARNVRMAEPRRDPVDNGGFQTFVIENCREEETGKFRLAPHCAFCFETQPRENRIRPPETNHLCCGLRSTTHRASPEKLCLFIISTFPNEKIFSSFTASVAKTRPHLAYKPYRRRRGYDRAPESPAHAPPAALRRAPRRCLPHHPLSQSRQGPER